MRLEYGKQQPSPSPVSQEGPDKYRPKDTYYTLIEGGERLKIDDRQGLYQWILFQDVTRCGPQPQQQRSSPDLDFSDAIFSHRPYVSFPKEDKKRYIPKGLCLADAIAFEGRTVTLLLGLCGQPRHLFSNVCSHGHGGMLYAFLYFFFRLHYIFCGFVCGCHSSACDVLSSSTTVCGSESLENSTVAHQYRRLAPESSVRESTAADTGLRASARRSERFLSQRSRSDCFSRYCFLVVHCLLPALFWCLSKFTILYSPFPGHQPFLIRSTCG